MIRLDHVNIVVSDLERSVEFYTSLLGLRRGFEAVLEGDWIAQVTGMNGAQARCVFLESDDPTVRLELLQYISPTGTALEVNSLPHTMGVRHVAFLVDNLDALVERLRAAGVEMVSDPVLVPFAVSTMGRKRLCYFYDPDGTLLEAAAYGV